MPMTKHNRIAELRKKKGMSQEKLAIAVGTTNQQIGRLENGDRRLTIDWMNRLAAALDVSPIDLINQNDTYIQHNQKSSPDLSGVKITELDATAGAGMAEGSITFENHTDTDGYTQQKDAVRAFWEFPDEYVSSLNIEVSKTYIVEVIGDSMHPTLHSGDRIMVNTADRRPSPAGIFALHDGMGVIVKRVEHIMRSDPPRLRISSDNPLHATQELTADEVNIIGRVIWFGRRI